MTRNVEKSFTGPKCGKKFLRKDNMLQHVKTFTKRTHFLLQHIHGYICKLFYCYISLKFDFVCVKYFVLLTIDRPAFFADETSISTISFMLSFSS